jgi:uncharacterized membrane protein SpoIIM required for sporulation
MACDTHNIRNPRERARQDQVAFNWVVGLVIAALIGVFVVMSSLEAVEKWRNNDKTNKKE